ncbi:vacuolar ATPase proteolipid subunit c [Histoplasma capsulatum G186AR]|uniref:V-type proton ATPase proteolipid subunit n=1 Tax=Ajellomyces capsulatus (strain G186AR / H82 / ATCC MYA-2454 / RMSCC 2432) TaxID=447093 RepID=C0P0M6_AJECG|nr:vacuolar ATPase proteolipid subunit c [Histoplasma capsulatum G186AR]EEH02846.1 vacuolar ATPase proteolipid subunit c [Histoplasma capsulatum G186AR]
MADSELAPKFAPFIGMAGICAAVSYSHSPFRPLPRKQLTHSNFIRWFLDSLIPVVMAGIIAVYGLVVAVLIAGGLGPPPQKTYSLYTGFMHLAAGLSVGLSGLAAGYTIGVVGDVGVRSYMQQSRVFVGMVLILIFGEVLGLYGLIVALILNSKS